MTQGLQALPEPKPKRFAMNYHLLVGLATPPRRVRVQAWLDDGEPVPSVIEVWPTADWHEREAWDMMGIPVEGHPNLKRILMDDDWEGHPLRKDYPIGGEPVRFSEDGVVAVAPERTRAPIYEGTRIPHPIPTVLRVPDELRATGDVMTVNFGPNHPSTHGVLRLIVDLYGEDVVGLEAVVGYLHTGFEKNMEQKTWWKAITYPERIDYLSFQNNELVFVLAIEKLLELEMPPKASWMRTLPLRAEPDPLAPRLARHRRARAGRDLDVLVLLPRARADPRPVRAGLRARGCTRATSRPAGSPRTSRAGFYPEARKFVDWMPNAVDEYEALVDRNKIWLERTQGLGLLSAEDAIALGPVGPGAARLGRRLGPAQGRSRTSRTPSATSASRSTTRATSTRATACTWRRCASRRRSSRSASTGSRAWRASRGSPTTARSCCRRARSSTPRWSR